MLRSIGPVIARGIARTVAWLEQVMAGTRAELGTEHRLLGSLFLPARLERPVRPEVWLEARWHLPYDQLAFSLLSA